MNQPDIKTAKYELRNTADLTNWKNNPRSVLKEDFERLKGQILKHGVYKTLLINQDNIVLGGNMRLRAFKELGIAEVMCGVVETVDESEMLAYALSDNDSVGITDDLKLAEVFQLHPIETSLYKIAGSVLRPLESIINPVDPATLGENGDGQNAEESLDGYLNGNIKQIVLYYKNEEYAIKIDQLEVIGIEYGLDNNTDVITRLIEDSYAGIVAEKKAN